jgi:exodeoxyribonuclease-3
MKIVSYNVNGIRAAIKKGLIDWLTEYPVDIFCVQETKANQEDVDLSLFTALGYHVSWYSAQKKAIAAWLFLVKQNQIKLVSGMAIH